LAKYYILQVNILSNQPSKIQVECFAVWWLSVLKIMESQFKAQWEKPKFVYYPVLKIQHQEKLGGKNYLSP